MKFFDWVLFVLFIFGCFAGAVMAKTYLIPRFFPSAVLGAAAATPQEATHG